MEKMRLEQAKKDSAEEMQSRAPAETEDVEDRNKEAKEEEYE
jgi:hypothetical protein